MVENAGFFMGRTLIQSSGQIGGSRFVFVKMQGQGKNELVHPTNGMIVKNPFKGHAKAYAGDLVEYKMDGTGYILKTFEVAKTTTGATDTDIFIVRNGYRHVPFVGDIIMKAPSTLAGKGAAYAITAVEATVDAGIDVWKVTVGTTLGTLTKGDVLVEGASSGASVAALVTNPNMVLPCDYDFMYAPATGDSDFNGARYFLSPCLSALAYVDRMTPIPPAVKALNTSRVTGWFKI